MVLNYIWVAFFVIAFLFALISLCLGDVTVFQKIVQSTFDSSKNAFEISLGLTGVLSLWLGIMKIGEQAGIVNVLARALSPVFTKLFPDIPKNHPVMGSIFMNIASNMLGLDNAATPTGLKAMQQMQELNPKKDTATNPMIMFLVLNTSGLTIIPTTILAYRHRCVYSYPPCHYSCHARGHHSDGPLAAHQPASTCTFSLHRRLDNLCGHSDLGIWKVGSEDNGYRCQSQWQYDSLFNHREFHRRGLHQENQCL